MVALLALIIALVIAWYLSFLATRLDRLHHRVETSWANLDGLLQRRAAIALEIAHSELSDAALTLMLTQTAYQAREATMDSRSDSESALSGTLGLLLHDKDELNSHHPLLEELSNVTEKIKVAIALHTDAVNRTLMVRRKVVTRVFRLAGHAPLPITYAFEADVI